MEDDYPGPTFQNGYARRACGARQGRRFPTRLVGHPPAVSTPSGSGGSLVSRALPVYLALLLAILTAIGILLVVLLRHVLLIVFVSALFAAALSGPSEWLHQRLRLPRGVAALLIYLVSFAILVEDGSSFPHFWGRWPNSRTARRPMPSGMRAFGMPMPGCAPISLLSRPSMSR